MAGAQTHVVVGAAVVIRTLAKVGGGEQYLYKGAPIIEGLYRQDSIEHLESVGLIEAVEAIPTAEQEAEAEAQRQAQADADAAAAAAAAEAEAQGKQPAPADQPLTSTAPAPTEPAPAPAPKKAAAPKASGS